MSRISVNKIANRLQTKEISVDTLVDTTFSTLKPTAAIPAVRDNGLPLQVGDKYYNTADLANYFWNGLSWNSDGNNLEPKLANSSDPAKGDALIAVKRKGSSIARTQHQVNDEVVPTINDYGVVDNTGAVDATPVFLLAPPGTVVPRGKYFVNTMVVDINQFTGPGEIYTHGGQVIRLDNDPIATPYNQRRVMAPIFGGYEGIPAIYPTATNAPQGVARFRHPVTGEESFFINQLGSGVSWSAKERSCTSRFAFRNDGQPQVVSEFTPLLKQTHAHLSVHYENNQTWIYQSFLAPDDAINNTSETGCGWSKYPWKGAANVNSDLINYRVWGRPGSGHRYEQYGKACVQMSQDGRYMIMIGINYTGSAGGRTVFVYDRLEVETAADPLDCEPVYVSTPLRSLNIDSDTAYQGEASDGRFLYITWGSSSVFSRRGVSVYTLTGQHLRDIMLDGPKNIYTNDQLRNGHPTLGVCVSSEPEGLHLWGDKIYVMFTDNWARLGDVVAYNGNNYLCTTSNNKGIFPDIDTIRWRVTDLPALAGDWVETSTYNIGTATKRDKYIYELTPPKGLADEEPLVQTYCYPASVAQYPGSVSELNNMSFDHGGNWRLSSHVPTTDTYRRAMSYDGGYQLAIYDTRTGKENLIPGRLRVTADVGGEHIFQIIAGSGSTSDGGYISLYEKGSLVNPGAVRISSASGGEFRLMNTGATQLNLNGTDIVAYVGIRPVESELYDLGTISRLFKTVRAKEYSIGVSTCTITSGIGSPEGVVTTAQGSMYINRQTGKWWRKASGSGNTGWVETTA